VHDVVMAEPDDDPPVAHEVGVAADVGVVLGRPGVPGAGVGFDDDAEVRVGEVDPVGTDPDLGTGGQTADLAADRAQARLERVGGPAIRRVRHAQRAGATRA